MYGNYKGRLRQHTGSQFPPAGILAHIWHIFFKYQGMELVHDKDAENIPAYKAAVKKGLTDPLPYDRLMVHYRKSKEYSSELKVINKAIKVFEMQLEKLQAKAFSRSKKRATIEKLSNTIGKSTGLLDKKGKATFIPEPIAKWKNRKLIVQKKLDKASGK